MTIKIRQAMLLDLLTLAPLAQLYAEEAEGHDNFAFDLDTALSSTAVTIADPNGCFLLAYKDKEPVGFLWGHAHNLPWSKNKLAYDTILYVKPSSRKTSVAYRLMKEWEAWAKEKDAVEVQISIASGIHESSSVSFFKKLGYSYIGQQFRKEC